MMSDLMTAFQLAQGIKDAEVFGESDMTEVMDNVTGTKARFYSDMPDGTQWKVEITRMGS